MDEDYWKKILIDDLKNLKIQELKDSKVQEWKIQGFKDSNI